MLRTAFLGATRARIPAATVSRIPKITTAFAQKPSFVRFYAGFPALTRDVAKERVLELLEGYDKVNASKEVTEDTSFIQDLGLDSLDVVEVIMEVEHEFNIQIPDQEADSLKTVGQTIDYILSQPDAC